MERIEDGNSIGGIARGNDGGIYAQADLRVNGKIFRNSKYKKCRRSSGNNKSSMTAKVNAPVKKL